jgi:hypothetical protein
MSITVTKEPDGLIVVKVEGALEFEDLKEVQDAGVEGIEGGGKIKILVLAEDFSGWGKEGDWGDLTFMYEHDGEIERIAVLAEDEWKEQIMMFLGAGRRQASVEYFLPGQEKDARNWVNQGI